jgi:O-antigen/teichoic acid export membrane protein
VSLRNFRDVLGGDLAGKAFTALFLLGLLRWLKPADFALLMTLQSVIILAVTLPSGILNRHYLLTEGAEREARSYRALQLGLSTATAAFVLCLAVNSAPVQAQAAVLFCSFAGAWFEFARTHSQKFAGFGRWARAEVGRALLLIPTLCWVIAPVNPEWLATGIITSQGLGYLIASILLKPVAGNPPRLSTALDTIKDHRARTLALYIALVATAGQLPMLLIANVATASDVASFGAAYRYFGLLMSVLASVHVVILAKVAGGTLTDTAGIRRMQIWATAMVIVGVSAGYLLIPVIDGGKYPDSPVLFVFMSLALLPGLAAAPRIAELMRENQGWRLLGSQLLGLPILVASAFIPILTPATGIAVGVSCASLCQYLLIRNYESKRGDANRRDRS